MKKPLPAEIAMRLARKREPINLHRSTYIKEIKCNDCSRTTRAVVNLMEDVEVECQFCHAKMKVE